MSVPAADIEAIERATIAGVSPSAVEEIGDWLLPFDAGTIGRARSAVPLRHERCDPAEISEIEARYRARDLRPSFRLADVAPLEPLRDELRRRGYAENQQTLVQSASCEAMRRASDAAPAQIAAAPDGSWAATFSGEGFDPVDAAHRVGAFGRAPGALFASVREDADAIAVGVAALSQGWAGVHGMRTARARRGEGLAGRVLAGLAGAALARGVARAFLQVQEENAAARALYRRAGFTTLWRYAYWQQP